MLDCYVEIVGNVSSWQWQHGGMPLNAWALSYDTLGRLSASSHYSGKVPDNMYSEAFSYDRNSNIVSHSIYSGGSTPEVTSFSLVGNQRYDYDYDANGNLTCMHDLITPESYEDYSSTLSYNLLNLPLHLTTDGDDYIDFRYLADGTKVSAIGYEDYGFKYAGPFRYRVELGDAFIESSEAAGGRIWCYDENDPDTPAPENRYFITDHLGSTRVVLKGDGTLSMQADYLPYGGLITGGGLNVTENDYLWTGKELQHQIFDTPAYDSSARLLFTNGLFASLDPLAEKYPGISPYAYCAGNPVRLIDSKGMAFTEAAKKYVNTLISEIDKRQVYNARKIFEKQTLINSGVLNDRKVARFQKQIDRLNRNLSELESVRGEINTLESSGQVYDIRRDNSLNIDSQAPGTGEYRSGFYVNPKTGIFEIVLGDSSLGSLAHELKHAYQFETGAISSGFNKKGIPFYDKTDEMEAYLRGSLFGGENYLTLPAIYNELQDGPNDATQLPSILLNIPSELQKIANRTKSSFRINGVTYIMQGD